MLNIKSSFGPICKSAESREFFLGGFHGMSDRDHRGFMGVSMVGSHSRR